MEPFPETPALKRRIKDAEGNPAEQMEPFPKTQRLKEESKTLKGIQLNRWNRSQKHQRFKEESKTLKGTRVVLSNPDGTTVVLSNPGVSAFPGKASADTDIHKVTVWLVMLYYRLCSRDKLHQIIGNSVSNKS